MKETRIYIANLAEYNAGNRQGYWFDLPVSIDDIEVHLELDEAQKYEEGWIILDWEDPYGLSIDQNSDIHELNEWVLRLYDLDEIVLENLESILSNGIENLLDILDNGAENYIFTNASNMTEYAENFVEDCGGIEAAVGKERAEYFIDYYKLGEVLDAEGTYFEGDDGQIIEYVGK